MNSQPTNQPPSTVSPINEMDKAIRCLALELPAEVWEDVNKRWQRVKATPPATVIPDLKNIVENAHMAGQRNAGIDPSYHAALHYYKTEVEPSSPAPTVISGDYYPGKDYQRLFNVINESSPNPLLSQMQDIIQVVHEDFPTPTNQLSDIEGICQNCNGKNPTWYADNELFNKVNGSPNGIICPSCFENKSDQMGINIIFKAGYAASEPSGITTQLLKLLENNEKIIKYLKESRVQIKVNSNAASEANKNK